MFLFHRQGDSGRLCRLSTISKLVVEYFSGGRLTLVSKLRFDLVGCHTALRTNDASCLAWGRDLLPPLSVY